MSGVRPGPEVVSSSVRRIDRQQDVTVDPRRFEACHIASVEGGQTTSTISLAAASAPPPNQDGLFDPFDHVG